MGKNKRSIEISLKLYKDISDFCNLNELKTNKYIENLLKTAFLKEKYGEMPFEYEPKEEKNEKTIDIPTENFEIKEKNTIFVDKVVKEEVSEQLPIVNEEKDEIIPQPIEKSDEIVQNVEKTDEPSKDYGIPKVNTTRKRRKLS